MTPLQQRTSSLRLAPRIRKTYWSRPLPSFKPCFRRVPSRMTRKVLDPFGPRWRANGHRWLPGPRRTRVLLPVVVLLASACEVPDFWASDGPTNRAGAAQDAGTTTTARPACRRRRARVPLSAVSPVPRDPPGGPGDVAPRCRLLTAGLLANGGNSGIDLLLPGEADGGLSAIGWHLDVGRCQSRRRPSSRTLIRARERTILNIRGLVPGPR
jgi:hypothetical protein